MRQTQVDQDLELREEAFSSDPERANAIACARRFKSSWLELAEVLVSVKKSGRYSEWGYSSFEDYAGKELRLRPETVDKLTGSYAFLHRKAPTVLERDGVAKSIPSYQAIDFLRRAEEEAHAPEDVVEEVRRQIMDEGAPVAQVKKQFGDSIFPIAPNERKKRDRAAVKNVATRLRDLLGETKVVPRGIAVECTEALDKLLESITPANSKDEGEEEAAA